MPNTLNESEEKALIGACLGLDPDKETTQDFVIIAHTHNGDKCTGMVRMYSNCTSSMTVGLIDAAITQMSRTEKGIEMRKGPFEKLMEWLKRNA